MLALAPECGCTFACSAPKSCLGALDRELLDLVDDLAAAVVALAGQALGVLVREHRADGLEHGRPGEVLGRDQLELVALARELGVAEAGDLGIDLGRGRGCAGRRACASRGLSPGWHQAMSASASAVASAPSRRMTGRVALRSSTVEERPAARQARRRRARRTARRAPAGTSPSVRGSGPPCRLAERREDRPRRRRSRARAPAGTPRRAGRCAAARRRRGAGSGRAGWARARSPRARAAPARAPRAPASSGASSASAASTVANIDGRRLARVAPLERAQPRARLGLRRHRRRARRRCRSGRRRTRPPASAADERREVDARLGEVEAQRHPARIPLRAVAIAVPVWPSGTRGECHLARKRPSGRGLRLDHALDRRAGRASPRSPRSRGRRGAPRATAPGPRPTSTTRWPPGRSALGAPVGEALEDGPSAVLGVDGDVPARSRRPRGRPSRPAATYGGFEATRSKRRPATGREQVALEQLHPVGRGR